MQTDKLQSEKKVHKFSFAHRDAAQKVVATSNYHKQTAGMQNC